MTATFDKALVDELAEIFESTWVKAAASDHDDADDDSWLNRQGLAAVLAHLARTGTDRLPTPSAPAALVEELRDRILGRMLPVVSGTLTELSDAGDEAACSVLACLARKGAEALPSENEAADAAEIGMQNAAKNGYGRFALAAAVGVLDLVGQRIAPLLAARDAALAEARAEIERLRGIVKERDALRAKLAAVMAVTESDARAAFDAYPDDGRIAATLTLIRSRAGGGEP